jgi:hypothetical protein
MGMRSLQILLDGNRSSQDEAVPEQKEPEGVAEIIQALLGVSSDQAQEMAVRLSKTVRSTSDDVYEPQSDCGC